MKNNLENDVQNLQKEIKELEYRQLCESTVVTVSNVWFVALEYLRIFRHGFKESSFEWNAAAFGFLQKAMATDVSDGCLHGPKALMQNWELFSSYYGPKALMQNWELFSSYFDDIHVELKSMTNTMDGSILATTSTTFTISSDTLRLAFPHLNSDEHGGMYGGTWSPLAKRMEGQRLVMRGSVRFFWDSVTERVVRILTWSDMLTPFCRVLGNLEDVSHVFDRALVTLDCRLLLMTPC
ncbi:hypothetical protein PHMEG_00030410 [Phytophthora megakarya]|uniref:Uncharacterized protein n=1 Tax=Phytophthora megakarya TaxID=4795 RepID=A0A225V0D1_9STRA|nr:hypothetical protein PHMEG_00030410 [Phytophthora megakarya]